MMHHPLFTPCRTDAWSRALTRLCKTNGNRCRASASHPRLHIHKTNNANANATKSRILSRMISGDTSALGTNRSLALTPRCNNHLRRAIQSNGQRQRDGNINRNNAYECLTRYKHTATTTTRKAASSSESITSSTAEEIASETAAAAASTAAADVTPPTAQQLTMHALRSAVPLMGFGFMDNTIMIHAGHYVDCTLGVTFSLSTLAAAGIGQIFSGIGGVMFGDILGSAFRKISFGSYKTLTKAQRAMKTSRIAGLSGGVCGVTLGCILGLVNLLFVDEHKASLLKLRALEEGQEFEFEVEVDNEVHPGNTTVTVRGPDVDGVLASITASLASIGCSVVELHASPRRKEVDETWASDDSDNGRLTSLFDQLVQSQTRIMEDVFLIKDRSTHQAIENEGLDDLARTVLAAAKDPLNSHSLKAQVDELQMENIALADRLSMLENMLEDRQIRIVPSVSSSSEEEEEETKSDADEKNQEER